MKILGQGELKTARELLDDESAVLVAPGDAHALAEALRALEAGPERRTAIAARGRQVYEERASRQVLGARWLAALGFETSENAGP